MEKEVETSFGKEQSVGSVFLTVQGFEGDGQADRKNHGGKDKAVLLYPFVHYDFWKKHYGQSFSLPSFGENITISEITEEDVKLGDVFSMGEAVIQISQPRHPCYKIAAFNKLKDITAKVTKTGYSGFYGRVLEEGRVDRDSKLILMERRQDQLSIAEIFNVSARPSKDVLTIEKVMASEYAAESLKEEMKRKKDKLLR